MNYLVYSLDVWGHHGSECCEGYGCPCVHDGEHDDNRCECTYNVNDRCKVGEISLPTWNDDTRSDGDVMRALDDAGYVHASLCEVDDVSDEYCIYINSAELGRPLLQLERMV